MRFFLYLLYALSHTSLAAQMTVTDASIPPQTPQSLVVNSLGGPAIRILSVKYNGVATAVGAFKGGLSAVGLEEGIVLTTGQAEGHSSVYGAADLGRNQASNNNRSMAVSPELTALFNTPQISLKNVAFYEIQFIPTDTLLSMDYVFASEEYPEYGCADYADLMGIFIQGPGYPNPTNIAVVPNTTLPIGISSIHPFNPTKIDCRPLNEQYYNDNQNSNNQPVYDGYTDVLTAKAVLQPLGVYTLIVAIADAEDELWDSAVFLKAGGLSSSFGRPYLSLKTSSAVGTIAEGCTSAILSISLPTPATQDQSFVVKTIGTAHPDTDLAPFQSAWVLAAGQQRIDIPLTALTDTLAEGPESIGFYLDTGLPTFDTVFLTIQDRRLLPPQLPADTVACIGAYPPVNLNGASPTQSVPQPVFSDTVSVPLPFPFITYQKKINVSGLPYKYFTPELLESLCLNITHGYASDLDIFLQAPDGRRIGLSTDNGGSGDDYRNTCFVPNGAEAITKGQAPFTGQFIPEESFSNLLGSPVNGTWILQVVDDAPGAAGTLGTATLTFKSEYTLHYAWTPTDGVTCPKCPTTELSPTQSTTYTLQATDTYGCTATDTVLLRITPSLSVTTPLPKGPQTLEGLQMATYVIDSVPGATHYTWTPPAFCSLNGAGFGVPLTLPATVGRQVSATFSCGAGDLCVQARGTCILGSQICLPLSNLAANAPVLCPRNAPAATSCGTPCRFLNLDGWAGDNAAYGPSNAPGFCGNAERSMWFAFTAAAPLMSFYLEPSQCQNGDGLQMALYQRCDAPPLVCDAGANGGGGIPLQIQQDNLIPGQTYYLLIEAFRDDICEFSLKVTPKTGYISQPIDTIGFIQGANQACTAGKTTYSIVPVPHAHRYVWDGGPGISINGQAPPVVVEDALAFVEVAFDQPGTANLRVHAEGFCNTATASTNIAVFNTPSVVTQEVFLCLEDFPYTLPWGEIVPNWPAATSSFQKTLANAAGCDSLVKINLRVVEAVARIANMGGSPILCLPPGGLVLRSDPSPAPSQKTWRDETGAAIGMGDTLYVAKPGRYVLVTESSNQAFLCAASDTVWVQEGLAATVGIQGDSILGLRRKNLWLRVAPRLPWLSYYWVGPTLSDTLRADSLRVGRAGTYRLIARDSSGCFEIVEKIVIWKTIRDSSATSTDPNLGNQRPVSTPDLAYETGADGRSMVPDPTLTPNPSQGLYRLRQAPPGSLLRILAPDGRLLRRLTVNGETLLDLRDQASGLYRAVLTDERGKLLKVFAVVKED